MKRFKLDSTKILSIVTASVLLILLVTGCGKKKAVVTSLATKQTTELTTATTTTEETTTTETETETETTTEAVTETTELTTAVTTTEEETAATKKKKTAKKKTTSNVSNGKVKTTAFRAKVYAKNKMNVRSGPGTNYKIVKTLEKGDAIDVRYKTSNGWYKTINGNYVLASLTTKTRPASE